MGICIYVYYDSMYNLGVAKVEKDRKGMGGKVCNEQLSSSLRVYTREKQGGEKEEIITSGIFGLDTCTYEM